MEEKTGRIRWYEIVYVVILLLLFAHILMNPSRARVGVVDLKRVAEGVGIDARMIQDAKSAQQDAAVQMSALQLQATKQAEALSKDLDKAPAAQKDEIRAQIEEIQRQFKSDASALQGGLQRHIQQVQATFFARVKPSIEKAAKRRRIDIVLDPIIGVPYINPKVDITEDVIKDCRPVFAGMPPLIDPSLVGQPSASNSPLPALSKP